MSRKKQPEIPAPPKECILCGTCVQHCPMVRATGNEELGPRAKHYLFQLVRKDPQALERKDAVALASLCASCGRCADACPQGVSGADLVARIRALHPGWEQWLWKAWMGGNALLWPALASAASLVPELGGEARNRASRAIQSMRALGGGAGFAPWIAVSRWDTCGQGRKAVLFAGCTATHVQKGWAAKAAQILAGLGYDASREPDWTCCGATLGSAGVPKAQHAARMRNLRAWREAERPVIATFCASCRHGLEGYATDDSLDWGAGEAEAFAASVVPLSSLWGKTRFALLPEGPRHVAYHVPCHDKTAHAGGADAAWLERVLGESLVASRDRCCGMGGVLQLGAPELSARLAAERWDDLKRVAPEAEVVLSGCSGCVTQLRATAPGNMRVGHWLDALVLE